MYYQLRIGLPLKDVLLIVDYEFLKCPLYDVKLRIRPMG